MFKVFVLNDQKEQATRGGTPVRCFLKDESDHDVCRVNVLDNRDGSYSCSYEAPKPGTFVLHVRIAKEHIKDSPFRPMVISGEPCPSKCVATGPGVKSAVAGELTHFTVQSKDMSGNNMDKGGFTVVAVLKDPKGDIPVAIKDNEDGTYSASYTPLTSGPINLSVVVTTEAFGSGEIEDAPFTVAVNPAAPDPTKSTASGPGINGTSAGEVGVITIHTADRFGNVCTSGGAPLNVSFTHKQSNASSTASTTTTPAPGSDLTVKDNKDGTYTVEYKPKKVGDYCLKVGIQETPIKDSPIEFTVLPGLPSALNFDLSGLELDGNGKRVVVAGVTDKYKVQARDAFGNPLTTGGLKLEGHVSGSSSVPVLSADNGDGTYEISYTPTIVGDYELTVTLDGTKIGNTAGKNPFPLVVIPSKATGAYSTAFGPGLTKAAIDGSDNSFTVQTADKFGNKVIVGGSNVAGSLTSVSDPSSPAVPIKAVDNGDGSYTCTYPSLTKAGVYHVTPTVEGEAVQAAPFELKVAPGFHSLDNTLVSFEDSAVSGLPGAHVQLRDKFANALFTGGDIVEASLLGTEVLPVNARDRGDGSYDLLFPPHFRGEYDVVVKVNDQAAPGGPWKVDVTPNPISDEVKEGIQTLVPGNAALWLRLLEDASESERTLILKELSSLVNKTPFEAPPAEYTPDPVLTLPSGGPSGAIVRPKKPGQRAPTANPVLAQQEREKESQEAKEKDEAEAGPVKKTYGAPSGMGGMAAMAQAAAAKRQKEQEEKGIVYDAKEVSGTREEVPEVKPEEPSKIPVGTKIGFGAIGNLGNLRGNLKKVGDSQ